MNPLTLGGTKIPPPVNGQTGVLRTRGERTEITKGNQIMKNSLNFQTISGWRMTVAAFLAALVATLWFGSTSATQAVTPPPDGGYPGGNTAEGDNALFSLTSTGFENTAIGSFTLYSNTTGILNTAVGYLALYNNTNHFNTAVGGFALSNNTTGFENTANGDTALYNNTTGFLNTATGGEALFFNTTGYQNTATGDEALFHNTTGADNIANGFQALFSNTTGFENTAIGVGALYSDATGNQNTATGYEALYYNTSGDDNTANGFQALFRDTTGSGNAANGAGALYSNTAGAANAANGASALFSNTTGFGNTADGSHALENNTTGRFNISMGFGAGGNLTTGDNNIDIGNQGVAGEANTIRIGTLGTQTAIYVAGIMQKTVPMSTPVFVNASGQLGTTPSSARFKDEIKPINKASEAILALKPVTFHYKKEIDPEGIPQFGLVAEDVEKVNRDLVVRDVDGKPYTVRYEAVNAMLLNEFLKEHATVQELKREIATLKAGLQKVSAQVEVSKPAPLIVVDNQ
jgi:hypothetical protein